MRRTRRLTAAALGILALAAGAAPRPALGAFLPQGEAHPVDPGPSCPGTEAVAAPRPAGGYTAAWASGSQLWLRRLDGEGRPAAPPLLLASGEPRQPVLVALRDGGLALFWYDRARQRVLVRWSADGASFAAEREVGSAGGDRGAGFNGLHAVALAGGAAVVWAQEARVLLRVYDASGQPDGEPRLIEGYGSVAGDHPAVFDPLAVARADGSLLLLWVTGQLLPSYDEEGEIAGKSLRRDPQLGVYQLGELVRLGYGRRPGGAATLDGGFLLAYATRDAYPNVSPPVAGVLARRFGAALEELGTVHLDQGEWARLGGTVVAPLAGGRFLVAWEAEARQRPPEVAAQVFVRELDAAGELAGPQRSLVDGGSSGQAAPALVGGADGGLLTLWGELDNPLLGRPALCIESWVRARVWRSTCGPEGGSLCLAGDRFELALTYFDPGRGVNGSGVPVALTGDTGYFWFFAADNAEVIAKVIDARSVNGYYWVFWGSLSDLGLRLEVHDTVTGRRQVYENPPGSFASGGDTRAFSPFPAVEVAALRALALDRNAFPAGPAASGASPEPSPAPPAAATGAAGPCTEPLLSEQPGPGLCLSGHRFAVEVEWEDFAGNRGAGVGLPLGDDSGVFWFFGRDNVELAVKVLDARAVNGRFWVFYGALTDVAYLLTIRHVEDGTEWRRRHPGGHFQSGADTEALAPPGCGCPEVYAPVCGADGRTYDNRCAAYCEGWVAVAAEGPCPGEP